MNIGLLRRPISIYLDRRRSTISWYFERTASIRPVLLLESRQLMSKLIWFPRIHDFLALLKILEITSPSPSKQQMRNISFVLFEWDVISLQVSNMIKPAPGSVRVTFLSPPLWLCVFSSISHVWIRDLLTDIHMTCNMKWRETSIEASRISEKDINCHK